MDDQHRAPDRTGSRVVYPPLDCLKPVARDLWIVDSGPLRTMGISVPVRMTVIRLRCGRTWLHSPTRYTRALHEQIENLGPIGHVLAPNVAHWSFLKDWKQHCPNAHSWAAPGLRERRQVRSSGVVLDHDLGPETPADWAGDIRQAIVSAGFGVNEVVFFHNPGRTLILTDLVENFEADKVAPPLRPLVRLVGAMAPDGKAPIYYRAVIKMNRKQAAAAARQLVEWAPERVIFAHGCWFDHDATPRLRQSLRWLLG